MYKKRLIVSMFFFKQKTAYEMRISDWSSDVCSSDLCADRRGGARQQRGPARGADLRYDMEIRLEDAFSGCTREIEVDVAARCETCDGSGAKPGDRKRVV